MKKLSNNLAMALLRGAIVLAGCMTTVVIMLFCNTALEMATAAMIDGFAIALITERVK
jgi:hypothetical protein